MVYFRILCDRMPQMFYYTKKKLPSTCTVLHSLNCNSNVNSGNGTYEANMSFM